MSEDEIIELENTRKAQTNLYLPEKGENVWAYISIYEYEIGLVKKGFSVEIDSVAYPGEVFQGKVVSINPVLDPATRTNQVRVEVLNTEDKLKPEMFVNAKIRVELGERLAIPEEAVTDTGIRKIVYLSMEGGILEGREIIVGQKVEGFYEVLNGLSEGDIIITSGNFLIDSEAKLKSSLQDASHQH
jgi:Cu(I)/Ag(I) efflux system membrane fusion protein